MNIQQAYDNWSSQYDTNVNKTRDLEAFSLQNTLQDFSFQNGLEIGCGTGKNTAWLVTKVRRLTAVDLSEEMLTIAKAKIMAKNVEFYQTDITQDWTFATSKYDLVTFSVRTH
jgi:ubiquinone/menaquinone biosynthesis C-methylase UbiE